MPAGGQGSGGVFVGTVAHMQQGGGRQGEGVLHRAKGGAVRLLRADIHGDEDLVKVACEAQLGQDTVQARVVVGEHHEAQPGGGELLQSLQHSGQHTPAAALGKGFPERGEDHVELLRRAVVVEGALDDVPPGLLVQKCAGGVSFPALEGLFERCFQGLGRGLDAEACQDLRVDRPDRWVRRDERPGGIKTDGANGRESRLYGLHDVKVVRLLFDMRIVRVQTEDKGACYGALQNDGTILELPGGPFGNLATGGPIKGDLLAPIVPAAILCIGLNYRKHAEETGSQLPEHPILFMKTPSSVQNPGGPIVLPRHLKSDKVDYEAELAVVIGKPCKNVSPEDALDYVLGYTCANDVSARDWQKHGGGGQWCRGKTFDTFCPLGPCIVTPDELPDPHGLRISTVIGGEVLQDSNTSDLIFKVPEIIAFLSGSTTLLPGTVILTGTPEGVGMARQPYRWLQPGETVEVTIEHIGTLSNPVHEEKI